MGFIEKCNHLFNNLETDFNMSGSMPFVSVLSGGVRAVAGVALGVFGIGLAILGGVQQVRCKEDCHRWKLLAKAGLEYLMHGALNIIRGLGETLIGLVSAKYTYGTGNLVMILFNFNSGFEPKIRYGII